MGLRFRKSIKIAPGVKISVLLLVLGVLITL